MAAERARKRRWFGWASLVLMLAIVGPAATKARSWSTYTISGGSMAPTILAGDQIVIDGDASIRASRGEIWAFRMPPASGTAGGIAVKRVIGLPGETIAVRDGQVWIDDVPLDEPYLAVGPDYESGPITLGPDQYFLLGDQRPASLDSHIWGPVPADSLIGRAHLRLWPPSRASGL